MTRIIMERENNGVLLKKFFWIWSNVPNFSKLLNFFISDLRNLFFDALLPSKEFNSFHSLQILAK